jgi:hypothetical protein
MGAKCSKAPADAIELNDDIHEDDITVGNDKWLFSGPGAQGKGLRASLSGQEDGSDDNAADTGPNGETVSGLMFRVVAPDQATSIGFFRSSSGSGSASPKSSVDPRSLDKEAAKGNIAMIKLWATVESGMLKYFKSIPTYTTRPLGYVTLASAAVSSKSSLNFQGVAFTTVTITEKGMEHEPFTLAFKSEAMCQTWLDVVMQAVRGKIHVPMFMGHVSSSALSHPLSHPLYLFTPTNAH